MKLRKDKWDKVKIETVASIIGGGTPIVQIQIFSKEIFCG